MCKTCALHADTAELTMCTSRDFYTVFFEQFYRLRITTRFSRVFTTIARTVMNIKISLNSSIKVGLSTVSTIPITITTRLKFNETIII